MKRHGLRIIAVFLIGVFCLIGYSSAEEAQEEDTGLRNGLVPDQQGTSAPAPAGCCCLALMQRKKERRR